MPRRVSPWVISAAVMAAPLSLSAARGSPRFWKAWRAATVKAAPDGSRRASSADLERPLSSVHAASSDGAHEAQQRDQPIGVVTGEALEERGRQPARIDRRHERGASDLPEWCRGEAVTPPCAPPLDGAAIDADHLGQLPHAQRRCAVPQDRDQHHDRGNIDLGAEEAQRRRRRPRPAAIDRAAEAEAPVVLTPEPAGPATRLAPIVGRMKNARATPAPR